MNRSAAQLEELANRLLWVAGLLGVLLIAVVANGMLHGGEGSLNPVAQAAEKTANLPGGKLAMEMTFTAPGISDPVVGTGTGSFDQRSGRSRVDFSASIPGHGTMTVTSIADPTTVYVHSPQIAGQLPPGHSWMSLQPLLGHDAETAFGTNGGAKSTIEMLSAVGGDVQREDKQTVRGHLTTRYKATLDLGRMASILKGNGEDELAREYEQFATETPSSIPVEVWVDETGVARRIRMVQELPSEGGVTLTSDMTMEFFDFGPQPKIELPPADQVFDMTPLLRAELGLLDGSTYKKLTKPSAGPPLDPAVFRRKASALCLSSERRAKELEEQARPLLEQVKGAADRGEALDTLRQWTASYLTPVERLGHKFLVEMAALSPPSAESIEYTEALGDIAVGLERVTAAGRAFELGSVSKAETIVKDRKADEAREHALLRKLGIPACIGKDDDSQPGQSGSSIA